jgi:hypothetical protein
MVLKWFGMCKFYILDVEKMQLRNILVSTGYLVEHLRKMCENVT